MKFPLHANVFVHLDNHSRGIEHTAARLRAEGIEQCALSAGLVCVTANRRHFDRVAGLQVEDWTAWLRVCAGDIHLPR